ncbi:MAG: YfiR family protein [Nitrospirae bacterium]|nr:YfiR family protein [Nitrospirota bacterium]
MSFKKYSAVIAAALILIAGAGTQEVFSQVHGYEEYKVKAAFLYNFTKFIEWPADSFENADTPLTLCISGGNPFGDALDSLKDKTVGGRRLSIRIVSRPEATEGCHIVFSSDPDGKNLPAILNSLKNRRVLLVGEMTGFAEAGGIINFFIVDDKVRFEINVEAARRRGLGISSQLLKLARIVKEKN